MSRKKAKDSYTAIQRTHMNLQLQNKLQGSSLFVLFISVLSILGITNTQSDSSTNVTIICVLDSAQIHYQEKIQKSHSSVYSSRLISSSWYNQAEKTFLPNSHCIKRNSSFMDYRCELRRDIDNLPLQCLRAGLAGLAVLFS